MDAISRIVDLIGTVSDAGALLTALGPRLLAGMAVIVFVESGLLFPFLPGDSLLVTAAVLHTSLGPGLWRVVSVCLAAAIAGDQAGYWLGSRCGRGLFRDGARVLRTDRLEAAEAFFARYGRLALVLGRFVPVVRTYAPFAAGTARMPYRRFVTWNIIGAIAWVGSMTAIGVLLSGISGIADSIEGVVLVIVAISVLPVVIPAAHRWWGRRPTGRDTGGVSSRPRAPAGGDGRTGTAGSTTVRRRAGSGTTSTFLPESDDGAVGLGREGPTRAGMPASTGARGAVADLGPGSP